MRRRPFTFKVACSPHGAGADVEGEHGIIRGALAEQAGQMLRVDRLAARRAGSEFVESVARPAVIGKAVVQVRGILSRLQPGQQRLDRRADITDHAEIEPGAAAKVLGPQIDLRDLGVGRVELAIWEIGSQHEQRVAVEHRLVARRESDQPCHADVVWVVPLDMFLAAQCMDHRRLERFAKPDQLVVRTGAATAAQQRGARARVEEFGKRIELFAAGNNDRLTNRQCLRRRMRRIIILQRDVARDHNDSNAAMADGRTNR